jgi:DNA-binding transcriptional LysR family regulator
MAERPIDLGWMRIFAEIGSAGSLSSAAASLGLTQPAVSYQIRRLEEQIGVTLLTRQHRGVELTSRASGCSISSPAASMTSTS